MNLTLTASYIRLQKTASIADAIRAVHRALAQGRTVHRWCGPPSPFVDPGDLIFPETAGEEVTAPAVIGRGPEMCADKYLRPLRRGRAALLLDKSFLWGYMAVCSLRDLGFSFDLLSAAAVQNGALADYQLLVVPGGWAALKSRQLGAAGLEQVRSFVARGGSYLGLCGGAGLALQVEEGLGLLPVARRPLNERLPNFSGSIRVRRTRSHPFWWGLPDEISFKVWWPSQFLLLEPGRIQVLGSYGEPGSDFWVSDLNVQDTEAAGLDWEPLEKEYEINLDPCRLLNEPAVIAADYGAGRVLLSYPHLETPGDAAGNLALFNSWYDLLASSRPPRGDGEVRVEMPNPEPVDRESLSCLHRLAQEAEELIALGESRQLWCWRNPWLLQWQRGVRGFEFGSICILLKGLARELAQSQEALPLPGAGAAQGIRTRIRQLRQLWKLFQARALALLKAEEENLRSGERPLPAGIGPRLASLRREMFSCVECYGSNSYGGLYRRLLDQIDLLLFEALSASLKQ